MKNRKNLLCIVFLGIFLISCIFLYGCKSKSDINTNSKKAVDISNYYSDSTTVTSVPLILFTFDSDQKVTALKMEYDISTKKLKGTPTDLFTLDDLFGSHYQWDGKDKLYLPEGSIYTKKPVLLKDTFQIESFNDYLTQIVELNGITYKAYNYNNGIVLEENGPNPQKINIDLLKDNPEIKAPTPLLIFRNDNKVTILVHYYHPSKILDNSMISGLMVVKVDGKEFTTNKVNMKDQCCINPVVNATVIGNSYYVNTVKGLGQISISDNAFRQPQFFDELKKVINAEPGFKETQDNQFDQQPFIGKIGDLLLLSYGTRTNADSTYFLWGIHADSVVFKISIKNNNIFDDAGNKIGTTKNPIGIILLPNQLFN